MHCEALKGLNIPGISIITSKYPEFITIHSGPVGRSRHRQAEIDAVDSKT